MLYKTNLEVFLVITTSFISHTFENSAFKEINGNGPLGGTCSVAHKTRKCPEYTQLMILKYNSYALFEYDKHAESRNLQKHICEDECFKKKGCLGFRYYLKMNENHCIYIYEVLQGSGYKTQLPEKDDEIKLLGCCQAGNDGNGNDGDIKTPGKEGNGNGSDGDKKIPGNDGNANDGDIKTPGKEGTGTGSDGDKKIPGNDGNANDGDIKTPGNEGTGNGSDGDKKISGNDGNGNDGEIKTPGNEGTGNANDGDKKISGNDGNANDGDIKTPGNDGNGNDGEIKIHGNDGNENTNELGNNETLVPIGDGSKGVNKIPSNVNGKKSIVKLKNDDTLTFEDVKKVNSSIKAIWKYILFTFLAVCVLVIILTVIFLLHKKLKKTETDSYFLDDSKAGVTFGNEEE